MADKFHAGDHAALTETRVSGEAVYDGVLLHVRRDTVRLPNGRTAVREYIEHPGAVTILPILDSGELLMERQYRYPVGRELYELPAGQDRSGRSDSRDRQAGAPRGDRLPRRASGATSRRSIRWSATPTSASSCGSRAGSSHRGRTLDDGEFLETLPVALGTALEWVRTGQISDAKTIVGVFWAEKIAAGAWSADSPP